jgi:hypothetical protein
MSEFDTKYGSWGKGTIAAVLAGLKYLIVPLLLLIFISSLIVEAGGQQIVDQLGLNDLMIWIAVVGIPITIVSFFRGFYPKGSKSRLTFGAISVALVCIWIWMVTRGGNIALEFDQFGLGLVVTGLILLFILAAALKAVLHLAEYLSYRKEWLKSISAPETPVVTTVA